MKLNRRNFFKLAGGTTLGTAIGGCDSTNLGKAVGDILEFTAEERAKGPGIEKWVTSICGDCPGGCGIKARVVDGKVVKIEGNPLYPINVGGLCPKGVSGVQALYNPDRIRGPIKRVGKRGTGSWESISWDEAIMTVVSRLKSIRGQQEAHSLVFVGGQQRGLTHRLIERFLQAFGSPNYIRPEANNATPIVNYLTQGIHDHLAYDLEHTNYILSFGCPMLEGWSSPARGLRVYGYLRQGRSGIRAKIVQIDTRLSITAAKSDEWIPIKPGSEGALALGIAHVIIREELYDKIFVGNSTFGFEDWKDELGREYMGFKTLVLGEYSPSVVSEMTGIPADVIVRLAGEFGTAKPALALGDSLTTSYSNDLYSLMAVHSLNALVGSIGSSGGSLIQGDVPFSSLNPVEMDHTADTGLSMPRIDHAGTRRFPLASSVLEVLPESVLNEEPYKVNALFLYDANPLFSSLDLEKFYKAFAKIPFIVSFSPFLDESTEYADLVLPDHNYLEKWQDDPILPSVGYPLLGIRQPVITPLYNTRHTGDVIIDIASKIGGNVATAFPWKGFKDLLIESLQGIFQAKRGSIVSGSLEESLTQFLGERGWRYSSYTSFEEFWSELLDKGGWWDPAYLGAENKIFKTPSGKFEFYSQHLRRELDGLVNEGVTIDDTDRQNKFEGILTELRIEARGDKVFMPHYEPARYAGDENEYPFYLNVYEPLVLIGGTGANQPHLLGVLGPQVHMKWNSWVEINPETGRSLRIRDGDLVWVESPIGKLRVEAKLYPGAMPNVVNIPSGLGHIAYGRWAKERGVNPNWIIENVQNNLGGLAPRLSCRVRIYKA